MKKIFYTLIFVFVYTVNIVAQSDKKRGDDYFNEKNYSAAAEAYLRCMEMDDDCLLNYYNLISYGYIRTQSETELYDMINPLAENGNALAQVFVGYLYENGFGVEQSYTKAVACYRKSANQGNPLGKNNLGTCYYYGRGISQDVEKAFFLFKEAAEEGLAIAQYNVGYTYILIEEYQNAFSWLESASDSNVPAAQCELGDLYKYGLGVEQNKSKAVSMYKKAADLGYFDGQYRLGMCYKDGIGGRKDKYEAFDLFKKSSEQGCLEAQYELAFCYLNGIGTSKNSDKAFELLTDAADKGHASSQYMLGFVYAENKDYKKAIELYYKSAQQNNAYAQNALGDCYYYGNGVKQSYSEAVSWYTKAATQGYAESQYSLGYCLYYGEGIEKNYLYAYFNMKNAADQGIEEAQEALDVILSKLPSFDSKNSNSLVLSGVKLGTRYLILSFTVFAEKANTWVSISEDTFIRANNKDIYKLVHVEGIPIYPERYTFQNSNDLLNFELYFSRPSNNVRKIDFVEVRNDGSVGWMIEGIRIK